MSKYLILLTLVFSLSCTKKESVTQTIQGADNYSVLSEIEDLTAGHPICAAGGYKINYFKDVNNDSVLSNEEKNVTLNFKYVCNGLNGGGSGGTGVDGKNLLMQTTVLNVGNATCSNGGVDVFVYQDENNNGVLDGNENSNVLNNYQLCNGANGINYQSNILAEIIPASVSDCPNGGNNVSLYKDDGDNILNASDTLITNYKTCNGSNGTNGTNGVDGQNGANGNDGSNGQDGFSLITEVVTSTNCANGGNVLKIYQDLNRNNVADSGTDLFVNQLEVCNGLDGTGGTGSGVDGKSVVTSTFALVPDGICTNGGNQVKFWLDLDDSGDQSTGDMQLNEILVCNGLNGTNGVDGTNGTNGVDGQNGADAHQILMATDTNVSNSSSNPYGYCPTGISGTRVKFFRDNNDDNVITYNSALPNDPVESPDSLLKIFTVCNGQNGSSTAYASYLNQDYYIVDRISGAGFNFYGYDLQNFNLLELVFTVDLPELASMVLGPVNNGFRMQDVSFNLFGWRNQCSQEYYGTGFDFTCYLLEEPNNSQNYVNKFQILYQGNIVVSEDIALPYLVSPTHDMPTVSLKLNGFDFEDQNIVGDDTGLIVNRVYFDNGGMDTYMQLSETSIPSLNFSFENFLTSTGGAITSGDFASGQYKLLKFDANDLRDESNLFGFQASNMNSINELNSGSSIDFKTQSSLNTTPIDSFQNSYISSNLATSVSRLVRITTALQDNFFFATEKKYLVNLIADSGEDTSVLSISKTTNSNGTSVPIGVVEDPLKPVNNENKSFYNVMINCTGNGQTIGCDDFDEKESLFDPLSLLQGQIQNKTNVKYLVSFDMDAGGQTTPGVVDLSSVTTNLNFVNGDKFLLKDQIDKKYNGIYVYNNGFISRDSSEVLSFGKVYSYTTFLNFDPMTMELSGTPSTGDFYQLASFGTLDVSLNSDGSSYNHNFDEVLFQEYNPATRKIQDNDAILDSPFRKDQVKIYSSIEHLMTAYNYPCNLDGNDYLPLFKISNGQKDNREMNGIKFYYNSQLTNFNNSVNNNVSCYVYNTVVPFAGAPGQINTRMVNMQVPSINKTYYMYVVIKDWFNNEVVYELPYRVESY